MRKNETKLNMRVILSRINHFIFICYVFRLNCMFLYNLAYVCVFLSACVNFVPFSSKLQFILIPVRSEEIRNCTCHHLDLYNYFIEHPFIYLYIKHNYINTLLYASVTSLHVYNNQLMI